jgi:hypothetical protein
MFFYGWTMLSVKSMQVRGTVQLVSRTLPILSNGEITRRRRNRLSPTAVGATIIRSWNGLAASLRGAFIRALTTLIVRSVLFALFPQPFCSGYPPILHPPGAELCDGCKPGCRLR